MALGGGGGGRWLETAPSERPVAALGEVESVDLLPRKMEGRRNLLHGKYLFGHRSHPVGDSLPLAASTLESWE